VTRRRSQATPKDDPTKCGAHGKTDGTPCGKPAGWGTDHNGTGRCKLHGGNTPSGKKAAAGEAALLALRALAIPVTGSPVELLQDAVNHARGVLVAAAMLLSKAEAADIEIRLKLYIDSIERAARVAKPAADAKIDEAYVALSERQTAFLHELLEVFAQAAGLDDEHRNAGLAAVSKRIRERGPVVAAIPASLH